MYSRKLGLTLSNVPCLLVIVTITLSLVFCSAGALTAADFSGNWEGSWTSSEGDTGGLTMLLTQNNTSLSGTMTVQNTDCGTLTNVPVTGSVSGNQTTFNATTLCSYDGSALQLGFTSGTLSGDTLSGNYTTYVNGALYDAGSFSVLREPTSPASAYFDTVQKTYIGYYQRAGDPGGLLYWADRLNKSGGNLNDIIEAFAHSDESQALYGAINSSNIATVVNAIYNALFNRDAESGGLNFYVNGYNTGQYTAATIMLNVLNGAQNQDLQRISNKLKAANQFTKVIDPDLDGDNLQVTYAGEADAIKGREFLHYVIDIVPTESATKAYVIFNIADPTDPIINP